MTLIELVIPLAWCGLIAGGATACGATGAVAGAALPWIAVAVIGALEKYRTGHGCWPPCPRCGGRTYACATDLGRSLWLCTCGQRYVRQALRWRRVTDQGRTAACMRWRPFRGWTSEAGPAPPARDDSPHRTAALEPRNGGG